MFWQQDLRAGKPRHRTGVSAQWQLDDAPYLLPIAHDSERSFTNTALRVDTWDMSANDFGGSVIQAETGEPIILLGAPGSPYTRKMIALLRYRGIPHRVVWGSHRAPPVALPEPKVKLLPTLWFPDGRGGHDVAVDSTPIIRRLETERAARSALPDHPVTAFFNDLIEDFADEWLTKAMFHYRWAFAADAAHAGGQLIYWNDPTIAADAAPGMIAFISQRQIDRLYVVGSNPVTAPTIEASYARTLMALENLIAAHGFVLGKRPSSADFALYGQLTQLAVVDPTPAALCAATAPRLRAWLDRMEDLTGLDPQPDDWLATDTLRTALKPLLDEIGRVYAPFLLANAQAVQAGNAQFESVIDGRPWIQPTFPYQAKCLMALRSGYATLDASAKAMVSDALTGTGCEALFA